MIGFVVVSFAIIGGVIAYQLGIFDRPPFEYQETLIVGKEQTFLYALVATITEKDIGKHVCRLMGGVEKGILESSSPENAKTLLSSACQLYGAPPGAEKLNVGLYFDDPNQKQHPRWGIGWAIQAASFEEIEKLVPLVQEKSGLEEKIRAVRVGKNSSILKARIPWHNSWTPAISPMFQWSRAFKAFEEGGYTADSGRPYEESQAVALEVYVTGPNNSMEYIDYTLLMGDVRSTWDDMLPLDSISSEKKDEAKGQNVSGEQKEKVLDE